MNFLDFITDKLNDILVDLFPCERRQNLGVVKLVRLNSDRSPKPKTVPGVYEIGTKNVNTYVIDDRFSLTSYFRLIGMNARRVPGGYGDENGRVVLTHNMALVVAANMEDIGLRDDEIALAIQFGFPERLSQDQLPARDFYSIVFNVNTIAVAVEQIFREEFTNVDFFLGPEHALLKVNFTIESTMNKKCFSNICKTEKI